jgi:hypothetical protein
MRYELAFVAAIAGLLMSPPAYAGASSFVVVNAAGADISSMSIRRVGSSQWLPLSVVAAMGKSAPVSFANPDCAFDLRATLADGSTVTWTGVNLCDVKLVTLRRNAAGLAWVDYD